MSSPIPQKSAAHGLYPYTKILSILDYLPIETTLGCTDARKEVE